MKCHLSLGHGRPATRLILFLYWTGRRRNECRKLTFDRVDLERGVVVFDANTTKSKRTNVVPVCREAWGILREAAAERGESDRVFPSRTGGFAWDVSMTFQTVCRAAGIHGAKLHDLRRGWISKTLARGVGFFLVRDLVGHLHVQTTEEVCGAEPWESRGGREGGSLKPV